MRRRPGVLALVVTGVLLMAAWALILGGVFVGPRWWIAAGLVPGVAGTLTLTGTWGVVLAPLVARWRWAWSVSIWWHQAVQLAVTAAAATAAGFLGAGWIVVVVLVAACALVALDAGAEGRRVERRRRASEGVREVRELHLNG